MNMCLLEVAICEKYRSSHFQSQTQGGVKFEDWEGRLKKFRTGGLPIFFRGVSTPLCAMSWGVCGWKCCIPLHLPPLFCYMSLLDLLIGNTFFDNNLTSLNFKLGVQANYPLAWMFFLALATAYPINANFSKIQHFVISASFILQSDWLEKKAYQLLCLRKEALGMRLMPTKTMVRHCYWQCINVFKIILHF